MPYEWSIGLYGSKFFKEVKEKGQFTANKCPGCGKVYLPPRRVCGPCFKELTGDCISLPPVGILTGFTVVNYPFIDPATGKQRPLPYTYGYVKIDGSDTVFSHRINETDINKLKVGLRVKAVFKETAKMEGNVEDILYFDIVK